MAKANNRMFFEKKSSEKYPNPHNGISPCHSDCPDRGPDCHSTCPKYLAYEKRHIEEIKAYRAKHPLTDIVGLPEYGRKP